MSAYLERIHRLQALLSAQSMTYDQLEVASGIPKTAIARWIKAARELPGFRPVVVDWARAADGRQIVPVFHWRAWDEDAPRPGQSRSPRERMAALRATRKSAR